MDNTSLAMIALAILAREGYLQYKLGQIDEKIKILAEQVKEIRERIE